MARSGARSHRSNDWRSRICCHSTTNPHRPLGMWLAPAAVTGAPSERITNPRQRWSLARIRTTPRSMSARRRRLPGDVAPRCNRFQAPDTAFETANIVSAPAISPHRSHFPCLPRRLKPSRRPAKVH